jgi:hypothetical protein
MNNLNRLAGAVALTFVLGFSTFAGETHTPPCADPGEMMTPPCVVPAETLTPPGETHGPPLAEVVGAGFAAALEFALF